MMFCALPVAGRRRGCLAADGRRNCLFDAPVLIAAKPVKPCDRGVFGGLNLLLNQEQAGH